MENTLQLNLTKDECMVLIKSMITQNAVNSVVDTALTDTLTKVTDALRASQNESK